jgi:hypothetical protein
VQDSLGLALGQIGDRRNHQPDRGARKRADHDVASNRLVLGREPTILATSAIAPRRASSLRSRIASLRALFS